MTPADRRRSCIKKKGRPRGGLFHIQEPQIFTGMMCDVKKIKSSVLVSDTE